MQMDHLATQTIDVSVDTTRLAGGRDGLALKVASPQLEVNVWLSSSEAKEFRSILSFTPDAKALCLSVAAGSKVHWSRDAKDHYYLIVGNDDETWDIALTMDKATMNEVLDEIANHCLA